MKCKKCGTEIDEKEFIRYGLCAECYLATGIDRKYNINEALAEITNLGSALSEIIQDHAAYLDSNYYIDDGSDSWEYVDSHAKLYDDRVKEIYENLRAE